MGLPAENMHGTSYQYKWQLIKTNGHFKLNTKVESPGYRRAAHV